MRAFKDANGVEWRIQLVMGHRKPIMASFAIDLLTLFDNQAKGLREILYDRIPDFIDLVFFLVRDQAEERGITDEQFGMALDPDAVIAARAAFQEEIADFFPDTEVRAVNRAALAKMMALHRAVVAERVAMIEEIDEQAMVPEIVKMAAGKKSSGGTLASSQ